MCIICAFHLENEYDKVNIYIENQLIMGISKIAESEKELNLYTMSTILSQFINVSL